MTTKTTTDEPTPGPAQEPANGGPDALDVLMMEAEQLEGAIVAPQAQAQEAQAAADLATTTEELREALGMVRMMAAPMMDWWPSFEKVWSDQQLQAISASGAAVMQRHGWTMAEAMGKWGPYIGLAAATLPPSLVTYQAVKAHRAETAKAEKAAQQAKQPERPAYVPPPRVVPPQPANATEGERL